MYIQSFLFYGTAIILLCLVALLVAIAVLYYRVNKAFYAMSMEFTLYKKDNERRSQQALEEAQRKAQEIINKTEVFSEEMKKNVMNSVETSLASGHNTYQKIVSDFGVKSAAELKNETATMTALYEKELEKEGAQFKASLSEGEEKILENVKARAMNIVSEVVNEALRKSISKEESERLVIESLEKIKKEYGFH